MQIITEPFIEFSGSGIYIHNETYKGGIKTVSSDIFSNNYHSMDRGSVNYYGSDTMYTYLLQNTDYGKVGVHFISYDLHPVSRIKVSLPEWLFCDDYK